MRKRRGELLRLEVCNNLGCKATALGFILTVVVSMIGCAANKGITVPAETKPSAELKAEIQRLEDEIWVKGNLNALDESYAADFILHKLGEPDSMGLDAYKDGIEGTRSVFPDGRVVIDQVITEGNMRVTQWTFKGTYVGPKAMRWIFWNVRTGESQIVNIPMPIGRKYAVTGCTIARMMDGKIVEEWDYSDDMIGPLQQSGIAFMVEPVD
jgi:predicted ester cyclase